MQKDGRESEETETRITIVIAEDQLITRLGLKMVLERYSDLQVVGESDNGQAAVEQAAALKPSVVVMDLGMPVMDGIEATKRIKAANPGVFVLMFTSHDHDDDVFAALGAGADGYCLKEAAPETIVSAIRAVSRQATWLDAAIAKRVLKVCADPQVADSSVASTKRNKFPLSSRETEVLQLLVDGLSNQQMAERLVISNETIKTHMRHIMEKLAVSDRTQAAVKALREGLLTSEHPG